MRCVLCWMVSPFLLSASLIREHLLKVQVFGIKLATTRVYQNVTCLSKTSVYSLLLQFPDSSNIRKPVPQPANWLPRAQMRARISRKCQIWQSMYRRPHEKDYFANISLPDEICIRILNKTENPLEAFKKHDTKIKAEKIKVKLQVHIS
jgi:hypothetical protein